MHKNKSLQAVQLPWEHLLFLQTLLNFIIIKYLKQKVDDDLNEVYQQSKFDVSSFSTTRNFQTGNFADFEQFKVDSHFSDFVKM